MAAELAAAAATDHLVYSKYWLGTAPESYPRGRRCWTPRSTERTIEAGRSAATAGNRARRAEPEEGDPEDEEEEEESPKSQPWSARAHVTVNADERDARTDDGGDADEEEDEEEDGGSECAAADRGGGFGWRTRTELRIHRAQDWCKVGDTERDDGDELDDEDARYAGERDKGSGWQRIAVVGRRADWRRGRPVRWRRRS